MTEYEQIIKQISEIINKSNYKKNHVRITEDNYDKYFKRMFEHDIAIEFIEELNKLLSTEEIMYHFIKYQDPYAANKNLIDICIYQQKKGHYIEKYNRIIEILNNAVLKNPDELKENYGYIILKSEYDEFELLCKELNVGMAEKLNDIDKAKVVLTNVHKKAEQYKRIITNIEELSKEPEIDIIDLSKTDTKIQKDIITNIEGIVNILKKDNNLQLKGILSFLPVLGYDGYCELIERLKKERLISDLDYLELFDLRFSNEEEKVRK